MWPLLLALTALGPTALCNTTAIGDLPPPSNVHIDSYNMEHVLRWDPVQVPSTQIPVVYRVECEMLPDPRLMCENISETQCDFTDKVKPFWRGVYKVRAEQGERRSTWAEAINGEFQPSIHTKIGPVQSLNLKSHANAVTVHFSSPFSPVPENLKLSYWLYYWKEHTSDKTEVPLKMQTHYILENLEELTVYCVQVKASTMHIDGQQSDPKCAKTMTRDYTRKELAVTVACVILTCVVCSVVGYFVYRSRPFIKRFLFPPFRMPYHIQEFLERLPQQPYEVAFDSSYKEEQCDGISVIESALFVEADLMRADANLVHAEKT